MRNARISRRLAEASFDGLDMDFDTAQERSLDAGLGFAFLSFEQGFDVLLESAEIDLTVEEVAARDAFLDTDRDLTAQVVAIGQLDVGLIDEAA